MKTGIGAQANYVAGVGRDFWLIENDVEHVGHGRVRGGYGTQIFTLPPLYRFVSRSGKFRHKGYKNQGFISTYTIFLSVTLN